MKYLLNTVFILLTAVTFGQKEGKEETLYTKEIDNPNISFIGLGIHFLSLQVDRFNSPIKFGGEAFAKIGKVYGGAKGFIGEALIYDLGSEKSSPIYSVYEQSRDYTNFETTAGVEVLAKESKKEVRVILFKQSNTYYYVNVPTTIKKSYGVEASLNTGNMSFTSKASKIIGKPTLPSDYNGTVNLGDEFGYEFMSTYYNYSVLNIGASQTKTYFVLVDSEKYGEHSSSYYIRFYGRLSFLLNHEIDDVIAPLFTDNNPHQPVGYYRFQLQDITPVSKIGFNIGVHLMSPRGFGGNYFAELGVLPGPKSGTLGRTYLNFGGGFSLSKLFKNNL